MKISYDKKVKRFFDDYNLLRKKVNDKLLKTLKLRINQLEAADTYHIYSSLGIGNPHLLEGNLKGCCGISITGNYRLIIELCVDDLSAESLKKCDEIIVKGVADYHGSKYDWLIP